MEIFFFLRVKEGVFKNLTNKLFLILPSLKKSESHIENNAHLREREREKKKHREREREGER